jgi:hypothetical protein
MRLPLAAMGPTGAKLDMLTGSLCTIGYHVLYSAWNSCDFFNRVFEFPLSRNAQKRNKQNRQGEKIQTHDTAKHFLLRF